MKKFLILTVTVFTLFACNPESKKVNDSTNDAKKVEITEATINISGMHCDMCVASIEKGINALEGIENVNVSLNDSSAIVKFNASLVSNTEIEKAIEKRGYSIKK